MKKPDGVGRKKQFSNGRHRRHSTHWWKYAIATNFLFFTILHRLSTHFSGAGRLAPRSECERARPTRFWRLKSRLLWRRGEGEERPRACEVSPSRSNESRSAFIRTVSARTGCYARSMIFRFQRPSRKRRKKRTSFLL